LYATYHQYGLEIVGVHTPEFTFKQQASNVQQAIHSDGLRYPVVQDNNYGTWNAYQNQYWPADYLIDTGGNVRHTHFGEGDYKQGEAAVRELLHEAGAKHLPAPMTAKALVPTAQLATPETYLNPERAQGFATPLRSGIHDYPGVTSPQLNEFALKGRQSSMPVAAGGSIEVGFQAADVYLVMTSAGNVARQGLVLLDGRPISAGDAGRDVVNGTVTVRNERLYSLVSLPGAQQHALTLDLPPGISAYAFTFG
jgi:hypothetical protein